MCERKGECERENWRIARYFLFYCEDVIEKIYNFIVKFMYEAMLLLSCNIAKSK